MFLKQKVNYYSHKVFGKSCFNFSSSKGVSTQYTLSRNISRNDLFHSIFKTNPQSVALSDTHHFCSHVLVTLSIRLCFSFSLFFV